MDRDPRLAVLALGAALVGLLLACAPGMEGFEAQPASWVCPTPSPIPTRIIGYEPTPTPLPDVTPSGEATPGPIFSTPVPTATPYERRGSDYYMGQRIAVGPLLLTVERVQTQPGPTSETNYQLIELVIENTTQAPIEIYFEFSQLRTLKDALGRTVQGDWTPNDQAAQALGRSNRDPAAGYPPGLTRRTLVFQTPAGTPISWGMSFDDSDSNRDGGAGNGMVWVLLERDPHCQAAGGGAEGSTALPPVGTPRYGSGTWPVAPDTPITRDFGCHSWYTGSRGTGCPASAPWWHNGIDFAAPQGSALFAPQDLTILFAGADGGTMDCSWIDGSQPPHVGYGLFVKAQDDQGYIHYFGHASRLLVRAGQTVPAGQQLAEMGSTGCSTGSHLHFTVKRNGVDVNPRQVIRR